MASYDSSRLFPINGAHSPSKSAWGSRMNGDQHLKQSNRFMARPVIDSRTSHQTEAPRGDPTWMLQFEQTMSYNYRELGFQGASEVGNSRHGQCHGQGQSQSQQQFVRYGPATLHDFNQYIPAPGPFKVIPRNFVSQGAFAGAHGPSPDLCNGVQYNQPGPMPRPSASQPFPAMSDISLYAQSGLNPSLGQSDGPRREHLMDSSPYRQALRRTFDLTRTGQLVEASQSLLGLSEWLMTNAKKLDILRDDHLQCDHCLNLWEHFNLSWLAVCQKQKDLTQEAVSMGRQPAQTSLLSRECMEEMGKVLIQLCDQLEEHGLVDYQMGIWEEEILGALGQCLDAAIMKEA
ncbi:hypothetical protein N7523_005683 [Penicillium sp. IBT 18751x]|nr:hypothetical protein N7523_005683 [Penicillium sp. IBT 18751x]